jgi:Xaa-Pro aminopeptidase
VGAFLNVHEGPQGIGFRTRENEAGFAIGMTTSNEPGYYEEGAFGIRIENVCLTVEAPTQHHFNGKKYCALETVTMTPIKTSLIERGMLTEAERQWVNNYHSEVRHKLEPLMKDLFPEAVQYLIDETVHI